MNDAVFSDNINGFAFVEYLTIFVSLIFAFAIADYLLSVGKIIREKHRMKFYWEFVVWSAFMLLTFIVIWYFYWLRLSHITESIGHFILISIPPFVTFLIVTVFFPNMDGDQEIDLKAHFLKVIDPVLYLSGVYLLFTITLEVLMPSGAQLYALIDQSLYLLVILLNIIFKNRIWLRTCVLVMQAVHIISVTMFA